MERNGARFPVFRDRFNALRGDMTQEAFAKFLGLSRATVGFYCSGERVPDAVVLRDIAAKCHISTDWLLGLTAARAVDEDVKTVCNYTGLTEEAVKNIHNLNEKKKMNVEMHIPTDVHDIDMLSLLLSGNFFTPLDSVLSALTKYPFKVRAVCGRLHNLLADAKKAHEEKTLDKYNLVKECSKSATDLDIAEAELYRSTMAIIEVARKAAKDEIADAKETMEELQTYCL